MILFHDRVWWRPADGVKVMAQRRVERPMGCESPKAAGRRRRIGRIDKNYRTGLTDIRLMG